MTPEQIERALGRLAGESAALAATVHLLLKTHPDPTISKQLRETLDALQTRFEYAPVPDSLIDGFQSMRERFFGK